MPGAVGCLRLGLLTQLSVRQSGPFPPNPMSPNARGYQAAPIPLPYVTGSTQTPRSPTCVCYGGRKGHLVNPVPRASRATLFGADRGQRQPHNLLGQRGPIPASCGVFWGGEGSVAPLLKGLWLPKTCMGVMGLYFCRVPHPKGTPTVSVREASPPYLFGGHSLTAPT